MWSLCANWRGGRGRNPDAKLSAVIEYAGATDRGCVRRANQDIYALEGELGLFVVADGMGGARAGERASRIAVETIVASIREAAPQRSMECLIEAIRAANRGILRLAELHPELQGMGTTVVAALVDSAAVHVASVGDSRAYRWRGTALERVTSDQTWVNEVGRGLGLTEEQIKTHPFRHVLTMAVGVRKVVIVRSHEVELGSGEELLLCSDGLHGVVREEALASALAENGALAEKPGRLIQLARSYGGPDNITAVVIRNTGG